MTFDSHQQNDTHTDTIILQTKLDQTWSEVCELKQHGGSFLTRLQEAVHPQVAESHSHDGGFVQVGGDSARKRQRVGELVKHLGLLAPPTSGRVTRTQLPLLRTGPEGGRRGGGR